MSSSDPSDLESVTNAARNAFFHNLNTDISSTPTPVIVTSPDANAPRIPLEAANMPDSDDEEYDVDQPEYIYHPKDGFLWNKPRMTEEKARQYERAGGYVRPLYANRRGVSENWDVMVSDARDLAYKLAPPEYPLSAAWRTVQCIGVAFVRMKPEECAVVREEVRRKKIAELEAQAQAQTQPQAQTQSKETITENDTWIS